MVNLLPKLIISLKEEKINHETTIKIDNYQIIYKNLTIITLS